MSQWHALVIGVDRYPAFPSRQLSGCVNDAEAMCLFLTEKVRVPAANLRRLVSPRVDSDPATRATASNIRDAFSATIAVVAPGDHVVFYCAGHGIRIERDASGGAKDRHYGFVPEDVARAAKGFANLILGREIYAFLRAIETKGATATVIADTCHSGGATRAIGGDDAPATRSLEIEPLSDEAWSEFSAAHPALRPNATRALTDDVVPTTFGAYAGGDFVMLTGCRDAETAKEHKETILGTDGVPVKISRGLMTHTLLKELERELPETIRSLRWMDLHDRLRSVVATRAMPLGLGSQTPVLEGRPEKAVFGGEWQPFEPGFTVRKAETGELTIDGGQLHGLDEGATVAIYPPDTRDFDAAGSGVEAVITSATAATSTARVTNGAADVIDRSRARLVRSSPATPPIVVRLHQDASLPDVMRARLDAGSSDGRFTLVAGESPGAQAVHAELRRDSDGWVLLNGEDTPDNVVAHFRRGAADDALMGTAIASGLACWARYLAARDRRAVDDTLRPMLEVRLLGSRVEGRLDDMDTLPVLSSNPQSGAYEITEDDWLWAEIRVKKPTALRLQLGWLAFSDDGNVLPLWPPHGADNSFAPGDVIYVGRDREQALPLSKRSDQRVSMWTLTVMACTVPHDAAPLNIWSLEQETVQEAFDGVMSTAAGATRGSLRTTATATAPAPEQPAWCAWNFRVAVRAAGEMTHDG